MTCVGRPSVKIRTATQESPKRLTLGRESNPKSAATPGPLYGILKAAVEFA
jgi:hypothetical protein